MNLSDAPYEKICTYCNNKITMSKESGNWLPYELNTDKKHDCRNKKQEQPETKQTKQEFTLEAVLKKLESIGIKINLMELMKQ